MLNTWTKYYLMGQRSKPDMSWLDAAWWARQLHEPYTNAERRAKYEAKKGGFPDAKV